MKTRYYYNGKLIRTSDHVYTHAVLDNEGKCVACRNGLEQAMRAKEAEKTFAKNGIRDCEAAIKALEAGKSYYFYKLGRCQYKYRFEETDTIQKYKEHIAIYQARIAEVDAYQVVELEAK